MTGDIGIFRVAGSSRPRSISGDESAEVHGVDDESGVDGGVDGAVVCGEEAPGVDVADKSSSSSSRSISTPFKTMKFRWRAGLGISRTSER